MVKIKEAWHLLGHIVLLCDDPVSVRFRILSASAADRRPEIPHPSLDMEKRLLWTESCPPPTPTSNVTASGDRAFKK